MLAESGFALDLAECAATGARDDLIYVSPKSGRAVSAARARYGATACCRCRRSCARPAASAPSPTDVADAFRLTGHFLGRELFAPRGLDLPDSRKSFLDAAARGRG